MGVIEKENSSLPIPTYPTKIVSGGQTGVDRAALDVAIALEIVHGGWCPLGRIAEDGKIPMRYALCETSSPQYHVRTERNVVDSDATLIMYATEISGGTALTRRLADKHRRPLFLIDLDANSSAALAQEWLTASHVQTLNVAGPRESSVPGIHALATAMLIKILE